MQIAQLGGRWAGIECGVCIAFVDIDLARGPIGVQRAGHGLPLPAHEGRDARAPEGIKRGAGAGAIWQMVQKAPCAQIDPGMIGALPVLRAHGKENAVPGLWGDDPVPFVDLGLVTNTPSVSI
jgi:hypothetical protein